MHREIELLKNQEALQVTRSEKKSVEMQVLLRQANVQIGTCVYLVISVNLLLIIMIAMLEDEKEIVVESQRMLTKMLNHAKVTTIHISDTFYTNTRFI
jgi:hypothetical protein